MHNLKIWVALEVAVYATTVPGRRLKATAWWSRDAVVLFFRFTLYEHLQLVLTHAD
jgi:hypothetical protein